MRNRWFRGYLAQPLADRPDLLDGLVGFAVLAFLVFADLQQQLDFLVLRQPFAQASGRMALIVVDDLVHDPAHRVQHVDGRIVVGGGQLARQHDVPVENRAGLVGHRLAHVVAFHQHGVERGDRAPLGLPGTLHQAWQRGEHRWRIAAAGGRFTGRQADFALGPGEAGQRVHQQQDAATLIAEILGDAGGDETGLGAFHRRSVGGGDHQHRAAQPLFAEVAFDELADFATAFADQGEYRHIHLGIAHQAGQQGALAAAGGSENAHALAFAAGQQAVDGAHTQR